MDYEDAKLVSAVLSKAIRNGSLAFGRLLSSEELRRAARDKGEAAKLRGLGSPRRFAQGNVEELETNGLQGQGIRLLRLPNGHQILVLAQQTGAWQHRFVLALEGNRVRQCLTDCRLQSLQFLLGTGARQETLLGNCSFLMPDAADVPGDDVDTSDFVHEQAAVVVLMLQPHALLVGGLPLPKRVCISVVQTSGNHAELAQDLMRP